MNTFIYRPEYYPASHFVSKSELLASCKNNTIYDERSGRTVIGAVSGRTINIFDGTTKIFIAEVNQAYILIFYKNRMLDMNERLCYVEGNVIYSYENYRGRNAVAVFEGDVVEALLTYAAVYYKAGRSHIKADTATTSNATNSGSCNNSGNSSNSGSASTGGTSNPGCGCMGSSVGVCLAIFLVALVFGIIRELWVYRILFVTICLATAVIIGVIKTSRIIHNKGPISGNKWLSAVAHAFIGIPIGVVACILWCGIEDIGKLIFSTRSTAIISVDQGSVVVIIASFLLMGISKLITLSKD